MGPARFPLQITTSSALESRRVLDVICLTAHRMYVFIFNYMPQAPKRWILDPLKNRLKDVVPQWQQAPCQQARLTVMRITTPARWKDYHGIGVFMKERLL